MTEIVKELPSEKSDEYYKQNPNFEMREDWYPKDWIIYKEMINWSWWWHIRLKSNWKQWMSQMFHLQWPQIKAVYKFLWNILKWKQHETNSLK